MGCHRRMQILCESLTGRVLFLLAMNRARKDYRALPLWAAQICQGYNSLTVWPPHGLLTTGGRSATLPGNPEVVEPASVSTPLSLMATKPT